MSIRTAVAAVLLAVVMPAAAWGQGIEDRLGSPDRAVRDAAVAQVLAQPETVNPFSYAQLSQTLWNDGRRLQAAFWFYVFQARTRPWADMDQQSMAPLRASLSDGLGPTINGWLGSDLAAWQDVARRAMSFEARLPIGSMRPDGVPTAAWNAAVANARRSYREGYEQTLARMDAADLARSRKAAGLRVGPLEAPGPALADSWR